MDFRARAFHLKSDPPDDGTEHLGHAKGSYPLAERLANEVISLPMCPGQTHEQAKYVIEKVLELA